MALGILGIDIGGTKLLARFEDEAGELLHVIRHPTGRKSGPDDILDVVAQVVAECADRCGEIKAIGIGFPGLVEGHIGRVASSVILHGWRRVPLADLVMERTGLPCAVDNDVNNGG